MRRRKRAARAPCAWMCTTSRTCVSPAAMCSVSHVWGRWRRAAPTARHVPSAERSYHTWSSRKVSRSIKPISSSRATLGLRLVAYNRSMDISYGLCCGSTLKVCYHIRKSSSEKSWYMFLYTKHCHTKDTFLCLNNNWSCKHWRSGPHACRQHFHLWGGNGQLVRKKTLTSSKLTDLLPLKYWTWFEEHVLFFFFFFQR